MSNPSKLLPVEYKVLLKMEDVEDSDPDLARFKKAGLALPPELKQREQMGGQRGTLIAAGGSAFNDWQGRVPAPGDRVYTARYPGYEVTGEDGVKYRLANDKDVCAVVEP